MAGALPVAGWLLNQWRYRPATPRDIFMKKKRRGRILIERNPGSCPKVGNIPPSHDPKAGHKFHFIPRKYLLGSGVLA